MRLFCLAIAALLASTATPASLAAQRDHALTAPPELYRGLRIEVQFPEDTAWRQAQVVEGAGCLGVALLADLAAADARDDDGFVVHTFRKVTRVRRAPVPPAVVWPEISEASLRTARACTT